MDRNTRRQPVNRRRRGTNPITSAMSKVRGIFSNKKVAITTALVGGLVLIVVVLASLLGPKIGQAWRKTSSALNAALPSATDDAQGAELPADQVASPAPSPTPATSAPIEGNEAEVEAKEQEAATSSEKESKKDSKKGTKEQTEASGSLGDYMKKEDTYSVENQAARETRVAEAGGEEFMAGLDPTKKKDFSFMSYIETGTTPTDAEAEAGAANMDRFANLANKEAVDTAKYKVPDFFANGAPEWGYCFTYSGTDAAIPALLEQAGLPAFHDAMSLPAWTQVDMTYADWKALSEADRGEYVRQLVMLNSARNIPYLEMQAMALAATEFKSTGTTLGTINPELTGKSVADKNPELADNFLPRLKKYAEKWSKVKYAHKPFLNKEGEDSYTWKKNAQAASKVVNGVWNQLDFVRMTNEGPASFANLDRTVQDDRGRIPQFVTGLAETWEWAVFRCAWKGLNGEVYTEFEIWINTTDLRVGLPGIPYRHYGDTVVTEEPIPTPPTSATPTPTPGQGSKPTPTPAPGTTPGTTPGVTPPPVIVTATPTPVPTQPQGNPNPTATPTPPLKDPADYNQGYNQEDEGQVIDQEDEEERYTSPEQQEEEADPWNPGAPDDSYVAPTVVPDVVQVTTAPQREEVTDSVNDYQTDNDGTNGDTEHYSQDEDGYWDAAPGTYSEPEDCNGNGSTADEEASAVDDTAGHTYQPVEDTSGSGWTDVPTDGALDGAGVETEYVDYGI